MTSSLSRKLAVSIERWPIAGSFIISRGAKTEAITVVATVSHGGENGRGECVPYPRYGETPEATLEALNAMQEPLANGLDRAALQTAMPAGAARNALDCALLDLEAKSARQRVWTLLGRPAPRPCTTAYTISLGTPTSRPLKATRASSTRICGSTRRRSASAARPVTTDRRRACQPREGTQARRRASNAGASRDERGRGDPC